MPATFTSDAQIKARVSALAKQTPAHLASYWDTLVLDAREFAYNEIVTALATRGYSAAQIAAWDRGGEYEKSLALFWAFTEGGALAAADDRFINKLDRRKELESVTVLIDGEVVAPDNESASIGAGDIDRTSDTFQYEANDGTVTNRTTW